MVSIKCSWAWATQGKPAPAGPVRPGAQQPHHQPPPPPQQRQNHRKQQQFQPQQQYQQGGWLDGGGGYGLDADLGIGSDGGTGGGGPANGNLVRGDVNYDGGGGGRGGSSLGVYGLAADQRGGFGLAAYVGLGGVGVAGYPLRGGGALDGPVRRPPPSATISSPLHVEARKGNQEVVKTLLEKGGVKDILNWDEVRSEQMSRSASATGVGIHG